MSEPVTTVVRRSVRADRTDAYEDWLDRLLQDSADLPGYLGAEVHPPTAGSGDRTYTSVFRFASIAELEAFESSDLRRRYAEEVVDYVEADAVWDRHTGLEVWFDPPPGTVVPQPVRWRMALVLGAVVYVLVLIFGTLAAATIGDVPFPLRLALVIAVEITLMTYLILPWITARLRRWIYPTTITT